MNNAGFGSCVIFLYICGMSKEEKLNREIRIKTIRFFFDDDYRMCYYTLNSNSFLKRLFSKRKLLIAAYSSGGTTPLFTPREYKNLCETLKTYKDAIEWQKEQYRIDREARAELKKMWNYYGD